MSELMELFVVRVVAIDLVTRKFMVQAQINPQITPASEGYRAVELRVTAMVHDAIFKMESMGWSLGNPPMPAQEAKPTEPVATSETPPANVEP